MYFNPKTKSFHEGEILILDEHDTRVNVPDDTMLAAYETAIAPGTTPKVYFLKETYVSGLTSCHVLSGNNKDWEAPRIGSVAEFIKEKGLSVVSVIMPNKKSSLVLDHVERQWPTQAGGHDPVNRPSHYTSGGIECLDAMQAMLSREEFIGFLRGNVFKYQWRYKHKNGVEDLKKADFYHKRLIEVEQNGLS